MSLFAHFDRGLITLHELNLLSTIFPELKGISTAEIQRRLAPLSFYPKGAPTIADLIELFPGYSLEGLFDLCDYLKLSRAERDIVEFLHRSEQLFQMPEDWQAKLEKVEWAQFYAHPLSQVGIGIAAAHLPLEKRESFLQVHQHRRRHLEQAIQRMQSQTPVVRAADLIKEGVSPSKKMGVLLKEAERINVNEGIEERDAIIQLLKNSEL
jgi:poly(A) polymerase